MSRILSVIACAALAVTILSGLVLAQQPQQPQFATTKVEGTDIFVLLWMCRIALFRDGGKLPPSRNNINYSMGSLWGG